MMDIERMRQARLQEIPKGRLQRRARIADIQRTVEDTALIYREHEPRRRRLEYPQDVEASPLVVVFVLLLLARHRFSSGCTARIAASLDIRISAAEVKPGGKAL